MQKTLGILEILNSIWVGAMQSNNFDFGSVCTIQVLRETDFSSKMHNFINQNATTRFDCDLNIGDILRMNMHVVNEKDRLYTYVLN